MRKCPSSIFNDVIGPVMRGPSSSHVAAAARIGALLRMSVKGEISRVEVDFDPNGSLAESYHGHGSDIGLVSGILGLALTDPDVPRALEIAVARGVEVIFSILNYGAEHPNHYRIRVFSSCGASHCWDAVSTGGGMVEILSCDGLAVSLRGDFHELLLLVDASRLGVLSQKVRSIVSAYEYVLEETAGEHAIINVKTVSRLDLERVALLEALPGVTCLMQFTPVLPTLSRADCTVPFSTAAELLDFAGKDNRQLWEMAALYESRRGGASEEEVFALMSELVGIMCRCVKEGLAGTRYANRILGPQAYKIEEGMKAGTLVPVPMINNMVKCVAAIMEVKSAMGVIVAAPTAGACAGLPGTVIGVCETLGLSHEAMTKAMLAAGLIGIFIAEGATFAAEVAGCQVECGAASGMAAAGIAQLFGGTVEQCLDAASMALQNITGLACDPVANRVEVPCLGKNIMGGSNAIASATMALAGFDKVVPLDETIAAISDIGSKLPLELRCTFGGLGKTPASLAIRKRLPD